MATRRALVAALSLVLLGTGCAVGGPPGPSSASSAEEQAIADYAAEPVSVAGLADCSTLPLAVATDATDGAGSLTAGGAEGSGAEVRVLPDLRLRCLSSRQEVSLRDLGGKPLVVNLWATWCGPCREEMPMLEAAHDDLGDRVAFLGVNTKDPSAAAAPFLEEVGVSYPQVVDPAAELLRSTRVPGLPVTLFVAPDGEVVHQHIGQLDRSRLDELVAEADR